MKTAQCNDSVHSYCDSLSKKYLWYKQPIAILPCCLKLVTKPCLYIVDMFINYKFLTICNSFFLWYTVTRKWNCIACPIGATTAASSDSSLKSAEETLTTIEDIEVEFAIMTDKIKQALINSKIDVDSLIEQLRSISGVRNRNVPLFDEEVFTKIKSVEELWKTLSIFWSIYDYDLLRFIVKITKCEDAQRVLEFFLSRIDPTVIEDVDNTRHGASL